MMIFTSTSPSQGELTPAFVFHGRAPPLQLSQKNYQDDHDDHDVDDDDDTCECLRKAMRALHSFSNARSHPPDRNDDDDDDGPIHQPWNDGDDENDEH